MVDPLPLISDPPLLIINERPLERFLQNIYPGDVFVLAFHVCESKCGLYVNVKLHFFPSYFNLLAPGPYKHEINVKTKTPLHNFITSPISLLANPQKGGNYRKGKHSR